MNQHIADELRTKNMVSLRQLVCLCFSLTLPKGLDEDQKQTENTDEDTNVGSGDTKWNHNPGASDKDGGSKKVKTLPPGLDKDQKQTKNTSV